MEAAYSSCNSLNYLGEQKWCCKSFDSEVNQVYDTNKEVSNTLKDSEADCIDVSKSSRPCEEPSTEFNGVTGKGVLLWLPPGLDSTKGNLDVSPTEPPYDSIGKNVLLNICPAGQDETRLALDNGRGEVEKKCLVNLIGASRLEDDSKDFTLQDGLVTVVDLSVIPGLISKIQTQEEVDYFCQKIIDHFRNILPLSSLLNLESSGEHTTKHNYFIVYNVLSRETNCNANIALSCEYLSESPKKSPKTRKAGKKSKRESTICGNEKKSKFTFDALIGSQTKILGHQNFISRVLVPFVTEQADNAAENYAVTSSSDSSKQVTFEIDLSGIEISPDLKLNVTNNSLTVDCASGVFNTHLKLKLPKCYKFPDFKNVHYSCNGGIMCFILKVQNLEPESTNKLLHHSASVDSGIGSDESCLSALSSILPDMIELDELADEAASATVPHWPQLDTLNEDVTGLATLTEHHQLLHKFAAESSSKRNKSGLKTNQKCFCDKITGKSLPKCEGTLLPTYEVSQTDCAIYLNIMCGVGIEIPSLQVCQISPHLISVSYTNTGTCSTPLRYCMHISSTEVEQKNDPTEKSGETCQSFKYESEERAIKEGNSLLKGVHLLESTLLIGIEKSTAGYWEVIWTGHGGSFWKSVIKEAAEEQTKQHLPLAQVPEPRRITDPSSRNGSDASTGSPPSASEIDGVSTSGVPNGLEEEEVQYEDEKSTKVHPDEKNHSDALPKVRENSGRKAGKGGRHHPQVPTTTELRQQGREEEIGEGEAKSGESETEADEGKPSSSSPAAVNVNAKKKFGEVILAASKNDNDKLRTKQGTAAQPIGGGSAGGSCAHTNNSNKPNVNGTSFSNNKKKNNKAVKNSVSQIEDKENQECFGADEEEDEVFESRDVSRGESEGSVSTPGSKGSVPRCLSSDWPAHEGKRLRRSSECIGSVSRKGSGSGSKDRSSPPLSSYRPRGILKRRVRSLSESHIGSLEECLGEELLGKYGSVERALVGEYGCLEGLLEECGWDDDEDDDGATKGGDETGSSGGKKSVRFSDVEKCHLFMSKASIVNQLANDDKKAMRVKMKEQKKKMRLEKRQAQKSGNSFSSGGSNSSSYRDNNGYNSFDDDVTTEESDGTELFSTSSGGDTTDNTEDETETPVATEKSTVAELNRALLLDRSKRGGKKRGGGKKNKKKRVELTNNMIFQLDMEA